MKRLLIFLLLVVLIYPTTVFGFGPKKVVDKTEDVYLLRNDGAYILNEDVQGLPSTYQKAMSLVLGGQLGYSSVKGGKLNFSVVAGFSYPISTQLYALSLGEVGSAAGKKSYGINGGFAYYIFPPGSKWLNVAIISRAGSEWEPDPTGDIIGSYLSGTGGLLFTFPFDQFWGGWISFETKVDSYVTEHRAVLGITSFL